MTDSASGPRTVRRAVKLGRTERFGLGFVGALSWLGGAFAVFTRELEAGPVALIAVGAIFLMVGLSGHLPTRLRIGEHEAEWLETVEEAFEKVIDVVPVEDHAEVARAVDHLAEASPLLADRIRQRQASRHILMDRLTTAANRSSGQVVIEPQLRMASGARPDALVVGPNQSKLWVILEDRYPKGWELAASRALLADVTRDDPSFKGILILCPPSPAAAKHGDVTIDTQHGPVWVVSVRKGEEPALMNAAFAATFAT